MSWGTPAAPVFNPADAGYQPQPTNPAWLAERDALLAKWETAKATLEAAKNSEAEARKAVQAFAFGPNAKEGMNNQELANGYVLKFGKKLNYKLDKSNDEIDKAEDAAAKIGNRGTFLFERIIVWKPEFSKSEYNKLATDDPTDVAVKKLIDGILTISEATGSLEIKEPKAKLNG